MLRSVCTVRDHSAEHQIRQYTNTVLCPAAFLCENGCGASRNKDCILPFTTSAQSQTQEDTLWVRGDLLLQLARSKHCCTIRFGRRMQCLSKDGGRMYVNENDGMQK